MSTDPSQFRPLFVLCAGRSFSSVVCSVIGQHPEMYGLPEMNFFATETLGELVDGMELSGFRYRLHGTVRTLAQLEAGEQTEESAAAAWDWLYGHRTMRMRDLAYRVAERILPRQMVEKSPNNVSRMKNLERMYHAFPGARYLHLVRHPRATGTSLFRVHTERRQRKELRLGRDLKPQDPRRVEGNWIKVQSNILKFTAQLAPGRAMVLKGEDLLADPDLYLAQICEWLGISGSPEAIEAMKHPEHSPFARPGPRNAQSGNNPGFLEDPYLRVGRPREPSLEGPLEWLDGQQGFQPYTLELARLLGYG